MWMSIVTQLGQHDAYMVQPPFSYSTLGSFQCDSGETSWPSVMMGVTPVSLEDSAAVGAGAGAVVGAGAGAGAVATGPGAGVGAGAGAGAVHHRLRANAGVAMPATATAP